MNTFKQTADELKQFIDLMLVDTEKLFIVDVDKDELWNTYINSFKPEDNLVFRERTEHDCAACKSFIKNFGAVVKIKNNKLTSIWDANVTDEVYKPVVKALSKLIHSKPVKNVFLTKEVSFGTPQNIEILEDGTAITHSHWNYKLPKEFVLPKSKDIGELSNESYQDYFVFKRSLEELTLDSIQTVIELSKSNTLYRGDEGVSTLTSFEILWGEYHKLNNEREKELFVWETSANLSANLTRIKNHSIGVLLSNISLGMDLEQAVKSYENIVAPNNYKRPKPIFTKQMIENAQKTVKELGYLNSLGRRFAKIDDITVNNILFVNRDTSNKLSGADSVFDKLSNEVKIDAKQFNRSQEISIDDFIEKVLPTCNEIEALVESKHESNFVSLIAPKNKDAKTMFKWDNNFSWAYTGNIADSMKQQVKNLGGNVDGVLRFSIRWNAGKEYNRNDFDAHCNLPHGGHVYYVNKIHRNSGINLDVDIVTPVRDVPAIENIAFPNKADLEKGTYRLFVNCFNDRGGQDGFEAEVEFDDQVYYFNYPQSMRTGEDITIAEVEFDGNEFKIIRSLNSIGSVNREYWNIKERSFVPVTIMMYSPNYWNKQHRIGNKHYFFMLKDCINPDTPNGFFNEYLDNNLNKHRKVFEALGREMRVEEDTNQLSGLGFSTTQRNELIVKTKGNIERIFKIKF